MKRALSLLLVFLVVASVPLNVCASEGVVEENVIYYEDGSYAIVTISERLSRSAGEKEGNKIVSMHDSSGNLIWRLQLMGYYEYDGITATCVSVASVFLPEDDAYVQVSKINSKSGNTASCKLVVGKKVLGITTSKTTHTFSLSCDPNGNIS